MSSMAPALERFAAVENNQYLTFMLGSEMYALGILHIKEIVEYAAPTPVPMMPQCIRGVINLRGAVVPVVDLSVRFGKPVSAVTRKTCVIIVETTSRDETHIIGVVVDAVSEVLEIASADIEPAPGFGTSIRPEFIASMGKVRGRFVTILDETHVLSVDEIEALVHSSRE